MNVVKLLVFLIVPIIIKKRLVSINGIHRSIDRLSLCHDISSFRGSGLGEGGEARRLLKTDATDWHLFVGEGGGSSNSHRKSSISSWNGDETYRMPFAAVCRLCYRRRRRRRHRHNHRSFVIPHCHHRPFDFFRVLFWVKPGRTSEAKWLHHFSKWSHAGFTKASPFFEVKPFFERKASPRAFSHGREAKRKWSRPNKGRNLCIKLIFSFSLDVKKWRQFSPLELKFQCRKFRWRSKGWGSGSEKGRAHRARRCTPQTLGFFIVH